MIFGAFSLKMPFRARVTISFVDARSEIHATSDDAVVQLITITCSGIVRFRSRIH